MKDLLEAGVHFGHQTRRWNPKMKGFIFGERNGIYIIDLQKTHKLLQDALQFVQDLAAHGRTILFVGTKRQAQEAIAEEAKRCNMPFVNERWLGGQLTNFVTVRKSLDRLRELELLVAEGRGESLTKKELARFDKERGKLEKNLSGIKGLKNLPDAVFIIDTRKEAIAVAEARKLKIPVVGVVDTNCDPDEVDVRDPGQRRRPAGHPAVRGQDRRRGASPGRRCGRRGAATRPPTRRPSPRPRARAASVAPPASARPAPRPRPEASPPDGRSSQGAQAPRRAARSPAVRFSL